MLGLWEILKIKEFQNLLNLLLSLQQQRGDSIRGGSGGNIQWSVALF